MIRSLPSQDLIAAGISFGIGLTFNRKKNLATLPLTYLAYLVEKMQIKMIISRLNRPRECNGSFKDPLMTKFSLLSLNFCPFLPLEEGRGTAQVKLPCTKPKLLVYCYCLLLATASTFRQIFSMPAERVCCGKLLRCLLLHRHGQGGQTSLAIQCLLPKEKMSGLLINKAAKI